eukprot:7185186-Pyramimonas_sp.AAC.1
MLFPPLMSVLHEVWRWLTDNVDRVGVLSSAAIGELQTAAGLALATRHRMRLRTATTVFCSDSSGKGYALHVGQFTEREVLDATMWRGRW